MRQPKQEGSRFPELGDDHAIWDVDDGNGMSDDEHGLVAELDEVEADMGWQRACIFCKMTGKQICTLEYGMN